MKTLKNDNITRSNFSEMIRHVSQSIPELVADLSTGASRVEKTQLVIYNFRTDRQIDYQFVVPHSLALAAKVERAIRNWPNSLP